MSLAEACGAVFGLTDWGILGRKRIAIGGLRIAGFSILGTCVSLRFWVVCGLKMKGVSKCRT